MTRSCPNVNIENGTLTNGQALTKFILSIPLNNKQLTYYTPLCYSSL